MDWIKHTTKEGTVYVSRSTQKQNGDPFANIVDYIQSASLPFTCDNKIANL